MRNLPINDFFSSFKQLVNPDHVKCEEFVLVGVYTFSYVEFFRGVAIYGYANYKFYLKYYISNTNLHSWLFRITTLNFNVNLTLRIVIVTFGWL